MCLFIIDWNIKISNFIVLSATSRYDYSYILL